MRNLGLVLLLGLAPACLDAATTVCADGRLCPPGTLCDDVHGGCVTPDQLRSCVGRPDADPCDIGGAPVGVCRDEICLRQGCGDGFVVAPEDCDGDQLAEANCTTLGFYYRDGLACHDDCTFDTSTCQGYCGNHEIDGNELCDRDDLDDLSCADLGFYTETTGLACSALCTFDTSGCQDHCGDDQINGPELCDGAPPPGATCLDYGFDAGPIDCNGLCTPDFTRCGAIGWRAHPAAGHFTGVWGSADDDLFAVGALGAVSHYDGAEWTTMDSGTLLGLEDVWGNGPADVWAVGAAGTILHYDGSTWSTIAVDGVTADLTGVWTAGADAIFAVGAAGTLVRYDGVAWTADTIASGDLLAVAGTAADDVYAAGVGGLLHFDGAEWTPIGPEASLRSLWISPTGEVFAGTDGGILQGRGDRWRTTSLRDHALVEGLWGSATDDVFAVGENGVVLHYDGSAWSWMRGAAPTASDSLFDAWGPTAHHLFAVGQANTVLEYRGSDWFRWPITSDFRVDGVWMAGPDDLWAVGEEGWFHFDHRNGWYLTTPEMVPYTDLWGSGPYDLFATTGYGQIAHYDGMTWQSYPSGEIVWFNGVWGAGPADVFAVGSGGWIFHWDGAAWSSQPSGVTTRLDEVWGSGPTDVFAVGQQGVVLHYDGGAWAPMTSGVTVELYGVGGSGPADVYAVGRDGAALHYDGAAWAPLDLDTPHDLRAVWANLPTDVFVAGDSGTLLHYDGERWAPVDLGATTDLVDLWGSPGLVAAVGNDPTGAARHFYGLIRTRPWSCSEVETGCGDGVDSDCDGLVDGFDLDCTGAVLLSELHGDGADVDYVEIANHTAAPHNLYGLTVTAELACGAVEYRFPSDAILAPGEVFRVIDAAADVRTRERFGWWDLCDEPAARGWVALCAGPCDLTTCENLLDILVVSPDGVAPAAPTCASFSPAPVATAAAGGADSVTRVGFDGSGAAGLQADWTIAAESRD